jgi:hypothetical protein
MMGYKWARNMQRRGNNSASCWFIVQIYLLGVFNGSNLVDIPFHFSRAEIDMFSEALCSFCVLGLLS